MEPATPITFEIETKLKGGRCVVAGQDVTSQVAGLRLDAGFGDATTLTLYARPDGGVVTGEGIVQVVAAGMDPGAAVRLLDPAEVEAKVSAAYGSIGDDPTATHLAVIAAMLDEQVAEDGP